jgi:class 3 adenylate cyclase
MRNRHTEKEVVILMTDMVRYSQKSSGMTPQEIRDFLIDYHLNIYNLINTEESQPLEIEPSAGDGSMIIFEKLPGEGHSEVCTRALRAALRLAEAVADKTLPPTRMGAMLGTIAEARLGERKTRFGGSFAVANRLEELCGYFGTSLLMDREVARNQRGFEKELVSIAKVSLASVQHPINIFTIYRPGLNNCPVETSREKLARFIEMKNGAMEYFCGNRLLGIVPDFPRVREELQEARRYFKEITGNLDTGIERILEYIRETPSPGVEFNNRGMNLLEKKRDSIGERLLHLSQQLLKAMSPDLYHTLIVDTSWENYFKLEWHRAGDTIIEIDSGTADTFNQDGMLLSTMNAGEIFGEMAYFGSEQKRTATVKARTEVVLRKISTEDFSKLPVIIKIFEQIAITRKNVIIDRRKKPRN